MKKLLMWLAELYQAWILFTLSFFLIFAPTLAWSQSAWSLPISLLGALSVSIFYLFFFDKKIKASPL